MMVTGEYEWTPGIKIIHGTEGNLLEHSFKKKKDKRRKKAKLARQSKRRNRK